MNEAARETSAYVLPPALITRTDLSRLVREVEDLDNELGGQKARNHATGQQGYRMPAISQGLGDFTELNKIDLTDDQARMELRRQLKRIKEKAPVIHLTFAVEADLPTLRQLAEYVRKEFHPQALLQTGLQPALVGGVYMRTPNRAYDFSIRAKLAENRDVIQQDIDQLLYSIPVVEAPDYVEAPPDEEQA